MCRLSRQLKDARFSTSVNSVIKLATLGSERKHLIKSEGVETYLYFSFLFLTGPQLFNVQNLVYKLALPFRKVNTVGYMLKLALPFCKVNCVGYMLKLAL